MITLKEAYAAGLVGGKQMEAGETADLDDVLIAKGGDGEFLGIGRVVDINTPSWGEKGPHYMVAGTFDITPRNRCIKARYTGGRHEGVKLCAVLETCNTRSLIHIQDGERADQVVDRLLSMAPDGAGYSDRATASLVAMLEDGDLPVCSCSGEHLPEVLDALADQLNKVL